MKIISFIIHHSRTVVLVLALLGLQYQYWLGENGYFSSQKIEKELREQTALNKSLERQNRRIRADIAELRDGGGCAVEERARYELGMVKNEQEILFVWANKPNTTAPSTPVIVSSSLPSSRSPRQ